MAKIMRSMVRMGMRMTMKMMVFVIMRMMVFCDGDGSSCGTLHWWSTGEAANGTVTS